MEKNNVVQLFKDQEHAEVPEARTQAYDPYAYSRELEEKKKKRREQARLNRIGGLDRLVEKFLSGKTKGVFGKYRIEGDSLVYQTYIDHGRSLREDTIALRLKRGKEFLYLGNSSILKYIGISTPFGNVTFNHNETEVQRKLALKIPMVPFSVFEQAKLDINKIKIIDRGPEETVSIKVQLTWEKRNEWELNNPNRTAPNFITEKRHFTGASLYQVGKTLFLFDIDRRELEHKIFNPFLVEIPKKVKTIKAAYVALKPTAVISAEKRGHEVLRQGEWFFLPVDARLNKKLNKDAPKYKQRIELRAGDNRPNEVSGIEYQKNGTPIPRIPRDLPWGEREKWQKKNRLGAKGNKTYVTGYAKHTGREHADLKLPKWYIAIPNTSTRSFTISGDID